MQNANNFIANSDYPFDMIAYYKQYTLTSDGSNDQTIQFAHGLPFTPLLFGTRNDKEDGSGIGGQFNDNSGFYVSADSQYVYIRRHTLNTASGKKFYFKIYGFAPLSWTGDCAPTASSSTSLLLDTDKEYAHLVALGAIWPSNIRKPRENTNYVFTVGKGGVIEIPNDAKQTSLPIYFGALQKEPMCMLWREEGGIIQQANWAAFMATGYPNGNAKAPYALYTAVGGGQLTVNAGMVTEDFPYRVHIRVYA